MFAAASGELDGYELADGSVMWRPKRADFDDVVEFLKADHAWQMKVGSLAAKAFDDQFRKALRRP